MRMTSVLAFLAIAAVCACMVWGSRQIEPHWVSKDTQRMVCSAQGLARNGQSYGHWREVRVAKVGDDTLEVRPRRGGLTNGAQPSAYGSPKNLIHKRVAKATYWKVIGPSGSPRKKRTVMYLLDDGQGEDVPFVLALRLPVTSKAIPMLDSMAASRHTTIASKPNPETR